MAVLKYQLVLCDTYPGQMLIIPNTHCYELHCINPQVLIISSFVNSIMPMSDSIPKKTKYVASSKSSLLNEEVIGNA